MKKIFIDTGAFYARYVKRDQFHKKSLNLWKKIQKDKLSCCTSNFVLSELITLLVYRFGAKAALQAAREIYSSSALHIISITQNHELLALDWLAQYDDQKFSMTDATSFSVMEKEKIQRVFTFDKHFSVAGFKIYQ